MLTMMILSLEHMCRVGLGCGIRMHIHNPGDVEACKQPLPGQDVRLAVCCCQIKALCMEVGHDSC